MNGMTRGSDMNREAAFCKIISGRMPWLVEWVSRGLGEPNTDWAGTNYYTVAFYYYEKLVGGLVYHDLRPGCDVWWTIFTTDKKWCNRKTLSFVFHLAFDVFKCRRVSVGVSRNNLASLSLVKRLGFKFEGYLRGYRDNGEDVILFGMLENECLWKEKK